MSDGFYQEPVGNWCKVLESGGNDVLGLTELPLSQITRINIDFPLLLDPNP